MSDIDFYHKITPFKEFSDMFLSEKFHPVPESWVVVITDVRGSTKAIQEGRYKQVNMIGASSISAVLSVIHNYEFPFVFGGDGATMLIPEKYLTEVCENLRALQALSLKSFNTELRAGYVSVRELYAQGQSLLIGKYELSPGNYLAQFKGTALGFAEDLLKNNKAGAVNLAPDPNHSPKIQGISCRLSPFHSRHGVILSLLCTPRGADWEKSELILREVLTELRHIVNDDFESVSPITYKELHWSLIPRMLKEEIALSYEGKKNYILHVVSRLLSELIDNILIIYNISIGGFSPTRYKTELVLNSDFKKFDGTLRMVIDCSLEQAGQIDKLMQALQENKKIFFGIHRSEQALLTCMVQSASQNRHIHFVDGSQGGYAVAAGMLKGQKQES